jgi:arylsulfatase A-like enzyme
MRENPDAVAAVAAWERPHSLLMMAFWFGLVKGASEALVLELLQIWHGCLLDWMSPFIWTITLSDAFIFAIPGLVLAVCARRGVSARMWKVCLFVFCTLAISTIVLAVCRISLVKLFPPAIILLAAGIASQVVRFSASRPQSVHRFFVRSAPVVIGLAVAFGIFTQARYWWTERQSLRTLQPAAPGSPNVILLVLDTVRAKSMSLYGYGKETTPNLERWARRGVLFDQAIAPSPYTLTSHSSMFTGRNTHELAADWKVPLESGVPTLAGVMHDHGYMTAGFVANVWYAGRQTGLDRGFGHYAGHPFSVHEILVRSGLCRMLLHIPRYSPPAASINDKFLRWLARSPQRPFFAFLNYADCHAPYEPEAEYQMASPEEQRQVIAWGVEGLMMPRADTDPTHLALALKAYENCLRGLDRRINELLKNLETQGILRNTLVIITSDHGEQFGEHNIVQHADSLYRPALHVPLMILPPNSSAAGQRVRQMVALRDLPVTILDLLKIPPSGIAGDSFAAAITNAPGAPLPSGPKFAYVSQGINYPAWHPNSAGPVAGVFLGGKYCIRSSGKEELYDFENDLDEKQNLIGAADSREVAEQLRALVPKRAGSTNSQSTNEIGGKDAAYTGSLEARRHGMDGK